ncbi:MAG: hypothetical protein OCC49_06990 [Fibrobacterales bacterium]
MSKLTKISKQLTTPIVKKLAPEIKLKNVKRQPKNDNSKSKTRKSKDTAEKSEKSDKTDKNGRGRNRNRNRNRNRPAPEVFSNEVESNAQSEKNETVEKQETRAPKADSGHKSTPAASESAPVAEKKVEAPKAQASSNRPTLAPRGEAADAVASSPEPKIVEAADATPEAEKSIRHGRRAQIKR